MRSWRSRISLSVMPSRVLFPSPALPESFAGPETKQPYRDAQATPFELNSVIFIHVSAIRVSEIRVSASDSRIGFDLLGAVG